LLLCGLGSLTAGADEVVLEDGSVLEGTVVFGENDRITLLVPLGAVKLDRKDVREIRLGPTTAQRYVEEALATDLDDPVSVRALAHWCRREGLLSRAQDLERSALGIELEQRLARAERDGADAMVHVASWALRVGIERPTVRRVYERVLALLPDHAGATEGLRVLDALDADDVRRRDEAAARVAERRAERERRVARAEARRQERQARREAERLARARARGDDLILGYAGTDRPWGYSRNPGWSVTYGGYGYGYFGCACHRGYYSSSCGVHGLGYGYRGLRIMGLGIRTGHSGFHGFTRQRGGRTGR
jgi:hypothetical protein